MRSRWAAQPWPIPGAFWLCAATIVALAISTTVAARGLAAQQTAVALVAALAVPLAFAMLLWPDASTLVVIFILYTNAAVVAVQFHGVPYLVGAAVPLVLVLPLLHHVVFRREPLIVTGTLPFVFLFVVVQVAGMLVAKRPEDAIGSLATTIVEGLGLYIIITNVVRTPEQLRRIVWVLLLAGAFMGAISTYQQLTRSYQKNFGGFGQLSDPTFEQEGRGDQGQQPRLAGPVGEKNRYAQVMLMLVPLGLFRIWGERSVVLKGLAAAATALSALGMAFTFSRGSAVGFLMMLGIMVLLGYFRFYQVVIVAAASVLLLLAVPQYAERLSTLAGVLGVRSASTSADLSDTAMQGRATEMRAAFRVYADYPVIGVGPGMFRFYSKEYGDVGGLKVLEGNREAHDLYLGVAAENGTLGLACLLAGVFTSLWHLARTRRAWLRRRPELAHLATGFMLAVVTYMTTGVFLHFAYVRYFWLMLALADAATYVPAAVTAAEPARGGTAGAGAALPLALAGGRP